MPTTETLFKDKLISSLTKKSISVLQINLGKRCNLACTHCHVEASPKRTEELSSEICQQLITLIHRFPEIKIVDLTGGAPEMNYGFKPLVEAARDAGKQVIVRSNLTIYFQDRFGDLPAYFAKHKVKVVASMPCYLADNVDKMRGSGVFNASIKALQWLNQLGYGKKSDLTLDLVYNPPLPTSEKFSLAPEQTKLERDYKIFLQKHFDIVFNNLFTITNLPIGRTKIYLERKNLYGKYLQFLESHFNYSTIEHLMCLNQLSIDYLGNVYDCDFNQMMNLPAKTRNGELVTVAKLLEFGSLDLINQIQTANYCYGCTAGCGSSCSGALL
ncbi:arsenosugar biosynthesis radical SAM (seleno)protein ArsS [Umezakia ovalisporum]|jgi:radical SAM/Cys-rich protein|uniref:Arsenosugar biosynthesis radical SAM protein ArsS n=1 Tax=Umezakia ovalisporum FSS-43 TaxID=2740520 RepID=A0ABT6K8P9_9CYAN|nr:arsenosugar biosynthesis radical SAM (seleno)protein ArsS [Umezakia ovalisporum]MBI1240505.1 radical SAM/Cys-rich domain protein [Nostoc sp. RI_552]MDH6058743.1 arsenosugar biosynthesis radical SAM protein ArsS [Umezakia ovalisporum FSS-43]MDH6066609.1 arsenosugar biosynthesis radical SAM protein ArsS [Umezakia ovalisporum APH033B]MDH6072257.1 arsenosugar biosynthesis radical SAM protein ArsS [Umezakia ovalisporum CobakiLakeA]MDH6072833.1 arsenosugar biosynthesis radical SAM protein ArsS [U